MLKIQMTGIWMDLWDLIFITGGGTRLKVAGRALKKLQMSMKNIDSNRGSMKNSFLEVFPKLCKTAI